MSRAWAKPLIRLPPQMSRLILNLPIRPIGRAIEAVGGLEGPPNAELCGGDPESLAFACCARSAFSSRLSPTTPVVNAHVLRKLRRSGFSAVMLTPN